jgi:primosomal protein N'
MQLLEVIPIAPSFGPETLSYFHKNSLPNGSLVSVPIRNRDVPAVVIASENASRHKTLLKKSDFAIKKIASVISKDPFFSNSFLRAIDDTARMYAAPMGSILDSVVPNGLWDNPALIKSGSRQMAKSAGPSTGCRLIQDSLENRTVTYRDAIKKTLTDNQSIFVLASTIKQTNLLAEKLHDLNPIILHSKLSKKKMAQAFADILEPEKSILIIGTYQSLSLLPGNTGLVVIDTISDSAYQTQKRPYFETSFLAQRIAEHLEIPLIIGDTLIPVEFIEDKKIGTVAETNSSHPHIQLSDMRKDEDKQPPSPFVGNEFLKVLKEAKYRHIFAFAPRRGLAGHVICNDCDQAVVCHNCQAPVVLHQGQQRNIFLCHACGAKRDAHETCMNCGGWNLVGLGLGIDRLEEEIKAHVPDMPTYKISSDHTRSEKRVQEELQAWQNTGGVLLGTQMALPYVEDAEVSVIASLDASLALPDFKSRERLFRTVLEILNKTKTQLIIQTRNPDNPIVSQILEFQINEFISEERKTRQKFGYPPEKVMIKISTTKQENAIKICELLSSYDPLQYQSLDSRNKKSKNYNILLKLAPEEWPNEKLRSLLLSLPRDVTYGVNPASIF